MTTEIRLIGVVALLSVIWAVHMGGITIKDLPGNYKNPVLAMELVNDGKDLKTLLSTKQATDFIAQQLGQDTTFIVLYVLLFASLGHLTSKISSGSIGKVGIVAAGVAIIAGVCDLLENRGIRHALQAGPNAANDALAHGIRYPSLVKWGLLYIVISLIGLLLLLKGKWLLIPGVSYTASGLLGLSGVVANLIRPQYYPMFPAAIYSMIPAVLFIIIVFIVIPQLVLRH